MAERRAEGTTSLREAAEDRQRAAAREVAAEGTARAARPAPGGAVAVDEEDGAAGEDEDVEDEAGVAEEEEEQRPKGRSNRCVPPAAANCQRWIWPMPPHDKCRTEDYSAAWSSFQGADCASIDRSLIDRRGVSSRRKLHLPTMAAMLQCSSRWTDTMSI